MAEENNQAQKQFGVQRLYTKDVSFETPRSPQVFEEKWAPTIELNLSSNAQALKNDLYEVVLTITVTVKLENDSTAYLIEASQAGIFTIKGFSEQEMGPMLGSYCPNFLFPYLREVISDLVIKGSFPPMLLAPVNFDALYAQRMQQLQQEKAAATTNVN